MRSNLITRAFTHSALVLALAGATFGTLALLTPAQAQTAPTAAPAVSPNASAPAGEWKYKTKWLNRTAIDKLLAQPGKVLVIDVRRPDELISKGSFPIFLSVQFKEVEKYLAYIPKDRQLIIVSNRAHRAGDVGDLLSKKGFKVAGAAGSLDYEEQGGTIARIQPPAPASAPAGK